jgi:hypothetical protein
MSHAERFYCEMFHQAVLANVTDGDVNPHYALRAALAALDVNTEAFHDLYRTYLQELVQAQSS